MRSEPAKVNPLDSSDPFLRIESQVFMSTRIFKLCAAYGLLLSAISGCGDSNTNYGSNPVAPGADVTILNVSYDPTREFYEEFNAAFAAHWQKIHGGTVTVEQSHGGSGSQARKVIDGLEADVVTLALAYDVDTIADQGLINSKWSERLPHNSAPYTSTIVFLVRKSSGKTITDWPDLIKDDVKLILANPKTGGGARWNYLAAWGYALKKELGDLTKLNDPAAKVQVAAAQAKAKEFVTGIYKNAEVLDPSARASTITFTQRGIGDVLVCWENEAFLCEKGDFQIVVPSISILAEPPVAVVDKVADKRGTRKVAEAYLQHLYSPQGQQLAAKHFYRPAQADLISAAERKQFAQVDLFTIDAVFGGWKKAQAEHFADGGIFDEILKTAKP